MSYDPEACDYGHTTKKGQVKRLDTGGGSGAWLCRKHWNDEMKWRKSRNKDLAPESKFPIVKFPGRRRQ